MTVRDRCVQKPVSTLNGVEDLPAGAGQPLLFTVSTPCLTLPNPQKPDFPGENYVGGLALFPGLLPQAATL